MIHCTERRKHNKSYDKQAPYYNSKGVNVPVKSKTISDVLCHHATILWHKTGVDPSEYTPCSLRAGGAMALILGGCNNLVVKLVGRWHSDSMMDYLHQAVLPIYKQLSSKVFANVGHGFPSNTFVTVH